MRTYLCPTKYYSDDETIAPKAHEYWRLRNIQGYSCSGIRTGQDWAFIEVESGDFSALDNDAEFIIVKDEAPTKKIKDFLISKGVDVSTCQTLSQLKEICAEHTK